MAKGKGKKRTGRKSNKSKTNQKTKNIEPEISVDFEEIAIMDITNISDNDIKEKSSILTYAKKNPEYAAFIFTVLSTAFYFVIRAIAFLYYTGICVYNKVDFGYINVNNDSTLFITLLLIILMIIIGAILDKIQQTTSRHPKITVAFLCIALTAIFIIALFKASPDINLALIIISSIIASILFILLAYLGSLLQNTMFRLLNKAIDKELKKFSFSTRLSIFVVALFIVMLFMAFMMGYSSANDNKTFKTVDDKYVVLYMNDEIAVCSPYEEENNCITIDKSIQKNFSLVDIEFRIKEFVEVE